jgi:cell division protein FtsA
LTGGTMAMPGVLELAQDLFHSNVRIAIPDYIGVREPQFTAGVGILQFAYQNAKIQGKEFFPAVVSETHEPIKPKRHSNSNQVKNHEPKEKKKKESGKVANLFKYFFD